MSGVRVSVSARAEDPYHKRYGSSEMICPTYGAEVPFLWRFTSAARAACMTSLRVVPAALAAMPASAQSSSSTRTARTGLLTRGWFGTKRRSSSTVTNVSGVHTPVKSFGGRLCPPTPTPLGGRLVRPELPADGGIVAVEGLAAGAAPGPLHPLARDERGAGAGEAVGLVGVHVGTIARCTYTRQDFRRRIFTRNIQAKWLPGVHTPCYFKYSGRGPHFRGWDA